MIWAAMLVVGCGELEGDDAGECHNGEDDDRDDLVDCDDPDCADSSDCAPPEDTAEDEPDSPVDSSDSSDSVVDTGPPDSDGDGVSDAEDCAPEDPSVYPGAPDESQDGVDQNCDGVDGTDVDQDGHAAKWTGGQDCDDLDPEAFPGAADAEPELCTVDQDGDGYGSDTVGTGVDPGTDCDDSEPHVSPAHGEYIDQLDNDCDGKVDEVLGKEDVHAELTYSPGGAEVGNVLALVEDLDGDGLPDFLISGEGIESVFLWTGPATGSVDLADAALTLVGETGWLTGRSLASGELTGDGVADLLVAVPRYNNVNSDWGGTFVVSGSTTGTVSLEDADAVAPGNSWEAILGYGVVASDQDDDGQDDLATGSSRNPANTSRVYVFSGPLSGKQKLSEALLVLRPDNDGSLNWSVLADYDHNGDGVDDLVVGAPYDKSYVGAVYVVPGGESGLLALTDVSDLVLRGEQSPDYVGLALASGGDVSGDGLEDLLVGGHDDAWLVYGNTTGTVSVADAPIHVSSSGSMLLGASVALGDWNADGAVDFAVGAPDKDPGAVYCFLNGRTGTLDTDEDADRILRDEDQQAAFGTALAGGQDLTGDSVPDLLIGAPYADGSAGFVWLMDGP